MSQEQIRTFCARLREERERLGWTREQAARIAGVARRTVAYWEADRLIPIDALMRFEAAGMDVHYVLSGARWAAVAETPAHYRTDAEWTAQQALDMVIDASREVGVSLDAVPLRSLVRYVYDHRPSHDELVDFLRLALEFRAAQRVRE